MDNLWDKALVSALLRLMWSFGAEEATVSPSELISENFTVRPTDCYAGVQYNSSGTEWGSNSGGGFTVGRGPWLESGAAGDYWVERTVNSGTLDDQDAGTGRLQLNTTRSFSIVRTANRGVDTANVTFDFYDAASGGSLLASVTLTFNAEVTNP